MIGGMGKGSSGRATFLGALIGVAGVTGGVWVLWANFCLWTCTIAQGTAFDWGLALTGLSFLLLVASQVFAVGAIRRRDGKPWAVAAKEVTLAPPRPLQPAPRLRFGSVPAQCRQPVRMPARASCSAWVTHS